MNTRTITGIIIHCAATPNGRWTTAEDVDNWHRERGFSRTLDFRAKLNYSLTSIGYHFLIYTNGAVATGRHLDEVGAHAKGFNSKTIGVCLVGTDKFTPKQWESLKANIQWLLKKYPDARVCGHRDLPQVHKTCPGFDVSAWLKNDCNPFPDHILKIEDQAK